MSAPLPGVELRRQLSVAPARVFAAFADAALVERWLKPAPEFKLTALLFEFREGGRYRFAYDAPDGQRTFVGGTYRAIEPPERIVFSWVIEPPDEHAGIESIVTATFSASGNGTLLVIRHDNFGRPDAEARHGEGWRGAIDQLDALLNSESEHGAR